MKFLTWSTMSATNLLKFYTSSLMLALLNEIPVAIFFQNWIQPNCHRRLCRCFFADGCTLVPGLHICSPSSALKGIFLIPEGLFLVSLGLSGRCLLWRRSRATLREVFFRSRGRRRCKKKDDTTARPTAAPSHPAVAPRARTSCSQSSSTMWPFCAIISVPTQEFFFRYFTLILPCSWCIAAPT